MKANSCPFCGCDDIRYSVKRAGTYGKTHFKASMYCSKCYTYGPRIISKKAMDHDYSKCREIQQSDELKQEAIDAWNNRHDNN